MRGRGREERGELKRAQYVPLGRHGLETLKASEIDGVGWRVSHDGGTQALEGRPQAVQAEGHLHRVRHVRLLQCRVLRMLDRLPTQCNATKFKSKQSNKRPTRETFHSLPVSLGSSLSSSNVKLSQVSAEERELSVPCVCARVRARVCVWGGA